MVACSLPTTAPTGLPVEIAFKGNRCGDERLIVANVARKDHTSLNGGDSLNRGELESRLQELFATSAERLLFLEADGDVPFGDVAEVIDIAARHVDYVAVLTRSLEKEPGDCLMIAPKPTTDHVKPILEMKEIPLWRVFVPQ